MMLGFLGDFRSLNDPKRQKLIQAFADHVLPFSYPQTDRLMVESRAHRVMERWLSLWPVRIGVSALATAGLWWALNSWLERMLTTLLPGVAK